MTKKQGYSCIVCFLTVSIITIILLLNGFIIHAEQQSDFYITYGYDLEKYGVAWHYSDYLTSSIFTYEGYGFSSAPSNVSPSVFDIDLDQVEGYSSYPNFAVLYSSNDSVVVILFFDENEKVISSSNLSGFSGLSGSGSYIYTEWNANDMSYRPNNTLVGNGDLKITSSQSFQFYFSNADIFMCRQSTNNWNTLLSYDSEQFFNVNYLIYDENGNLAYDNPLIDNGSSMSEDIDKGLYMLKGSCIYLSNKSFNDGTLYINALLTDDQKNNPNLTIVAKGSCTYSFGYSGVTPSAPTIIYTQGYSNQNSKKRVFNILWGDDANTLVSHNKTVNCDFGMLGSYPISIDYNSGNSGTNAISLSDVNNNMFTGDLPAGTLFRASIGNMASAYDSANSSNFTVRNFNLNLTKNISVNTGFLDQNSQSTDVYLTDVRYHFELYMVKNYGDSNADWSDIIYSYDVDMLRGTASVGTDGTLTYDDLDNNFDGNIPSQYLPSTDVDSSGGSSVSSSGGNNQVVTINGDDSAKYLPSLINKLLPSDSDSNGGLSEDFQNIVNSNGWLSVIKYSFSFIPESFWDTMVTYFTAIMGLLACAFLIRIILDLL